MDEQPDALSKAEDLFDRQARRYVELYMELTVYDESYRAFCRLLPPGRARVLDAACGPGNVARFLLRERPDLDLLGIDLAPTMIELARAAVPDARFQIHDCRELASLGPQGFDGIVCAFGLPYLTPAEAQGLIAQAASLLGPGGALYLSTMEGRPEDSGRHRASNGESVQLWYYDGDALRAAVEAGGFEVTLFSRLPLPNPAAVPKARNDLAIVARRLPRPQA